MIETVIDSSVLTDIMLGELSREKNLIILKNGVTIDLAVKETINAIWKHVNFFNLNEEYGEELVNRVQSLFIKLEDHRRFYGKAFRISVDNKITVYDSLFIALSLERNARLATLDRKQADVARSLGVEVV